MRKPLTVTLSVVCTLMGMLRQSTQRIKAMLLCIVYMLCCLLTLLILVFATLTQHCIQSNEVWKLYSVDSGLKYYICWHCQHKVKVFLMHSICKKFWKAETEGFSTIPSLLYMLILLILDISISNAFNAIYVKAVNTFSTQYTHM